MSKGHPEFLLFEATVPNLNEREWDECFRRRFLPSWTYWKKSSGWRIAFHKYALHRNTLLYDNRSTLWVLGCCIGFGIEPIRRAQLTRPGRGRSLGSILRLLFRF